MSKAFVNMSQILVGFSEFHSYLFSVLDHASKHSNVNQAFVINGNVFLNKGINYIWESKTISSHLPQLSHLDEELTTQVFTSFGSHGV